MNPSATRNETSSVCATIAPEDLSCGQMVAILNETYEYPSFLWCDAGFGSHDQPIRIKWKARDHGLPLEIKAICLPFILLEDPWGKYQRSDIRSCEFVLLDTEYAQTVKNCLLENKKAKKRKKNS